MLHNDQQSHQISENELMTLKFAISDCGIGISEDQQEKLFQSFSQADNTTSRKYGGTGLGLSICKNLVNLMHGEIWLKSQLEHGSTFYFTVQLKASNEKEIKYLKHSNKFTDELAKQAIAELSAKKILLVEDNEINQELILELLLVHHVTVMTAFNGQEALKLLETEHFDAVLMDCMMPIMDGYEATKKIREQEKFQQLPVIALTANAMVEDRQKVLDVGMNDYITKPIDPNKLYIILAKWLKAFE